MEDALRFETKTDRRGQIYFNVTCDSKDGNSITKKLSYKQLLEVLSKSYNEDHIRLPVGNIPFGYIDSYVSNQKNGRVRIYLPAGKRVLFLNVGEKVPKAFMVPMPPMMFDVSFGEGRSHGYVRVVLGTYEEVKKAYYQGILTMYQYPFGNVDTSGSICMGNINVSVPTMDKAWDFVSAFFDGITNSDYVYGSSKVVPGIGQAELLTQLSEMDEFPPEWLVKTSGDKDYRPYQAA